MNSVSLWKESSPIQLLSTIRKVYILLILDILELKCRNVYRMLPSHYFKCDLQFCNFIVLVVVLVNVIKMSFCPPDRNTPNPFANDASPVMASQIIPKMQQFVSIIVNVVVVVEIISIILIILSWSLLHS